jgi:hypothetical protein
MGALRTSAHRASSSVRQARWWASAPSQRLSAASQRSVRRLGRYCLRLPSHYGVGLGRDSSSLVSDRVIRKPNPRSSGAVALQLERKAYKGPIEEPPRTVFLQLGLASGVRFFGASP